MTGARTVMGGWWTAARIVAAGVLALALVVLVSMAAARTSCRFVLGFAALHETIGAERVGTCLEDEWTTTSVVSLSVGARTVTIPSGAAVQRTTTGVLVWLPAANSTRFLTEDGYWVQAKPAATYSLWDATEAQQASSTGTADH